MPNDSSCRECVTEKICFLKHTADQKHVDMQIHRIDDRMTALDNVQNMRMSELERAYEIKTGHYDVWMVEVNRKLTQIETRNLMWTAIVAAMVSAGVAVLVTIIQHMLGRI
jgi:hypothetical protein